MSLSEAEAQRQVRSWGFSHVYTWSDRPNTYYSPHTHGGVTTHLILSGEFTVAFPSSKKGVRLEEEVKKETFGPGARIDVGAGQLHEVWIGEEGSGDTISTRGIMPAFI
ncbi:hypothetical protein NEOLEDRAFT_1145228 [Neolentinus lepideus HHB14362 ss-1]|uniref:Cupin type-1 domain-containing protein n=1 Tax=Neolentinus lepideus HHB14362 ss-1 TaxID=1314782 RepID=A0A165VDK7_9AGAM|nr:hypothetical protein NEOLEDRAFT_1145228 [Neolentinus lepideus HHB14362 ss-1]